MAIPLFGKLIERKRVGFVGDMPVDAVSALRERGYDPYPLTAAELHQNAVLDTTGSIVLTQSASAPHEIHKDLRTFADALTYDCRIYVRHADDPGAYGKTVLLHVLGALRLPASGFREDERFHLHGEPGDENIPVYAPFVHIVETPSDGVSLANTISINSPSHPPSKTLEIEVTDAKGERTQLDREKELLVRRAFWNCKLVRLFAKTNGLSNVDAFEGLAYHGENLVEGAWPYRFFVKIGPRVKVAREYQKYRNILLENVPFHLGPRLRLDRCVLGRSCGLIVSDFVANAETIRDSAREGRGAAAIASLFNVTLVAWRRAAKINRDLKLNEFLADKVLGGKRIAAHRVGRMLEFGAMSTLTDLAQAIGNAVTGEEVMTGLVHGDLHATNVLVRMNDAVIIDLERIEQGWPLLFDVASLEAGLFIDGFIKDKRSPKEILASILCLYERKAFEHDDHHCDPSNSSAWFFECARQLRMQARQMERHPLQYAWVLAAVFIKKTCNPEDFAEGKPVHFDAVPVDTHVAREAIRQLAYVVGEKIVFSLTSSSKETPL